jgi:hypothetical protein
VLLQIWIQLIILAAVAFLFELVRRKAQNLAQKQDIAELTKLTENVRSQFQRLTLVHRVQFEAEFRHYESVWRAAHNVHQSFVRLHPKDLAVEMGVPKPTQQTFDEFFESA